MEKVWKISAQAPETLLKSTFYQKRHLIETFLWICFDNFVEEIRQTSESFLLVVWEKITKYLLFKNDICFSKDVYVHKECVDSNFDEDAEYFPQEVQKIFAENPNRTKPKQFLQKKLLENLLRTRGNKFDNPAGKFCQTSDKILLEVPKLITTQKIIKKYT